MSAMSDEQRQPFARMYFARVKAGLILAGEWTCNLPHVQMRNEGCIYDGRHGRWLVPDVAILNKYLAMRPDLETNDLEP